MLLLTYTPRADSAARGYDDWLRDVDNPFFNSVPGIVEYVNWKVVENKLGVLPFTYFDTMLIDGVGAVDRVWSNPDVQRFVDGWRERWALNPGADDMAGNYQVMLCSQTAGGAAQRTSRHCIFLPHIKAPDWRERDYDTFLRETDIPFFNSQPEIVHYSNWRIDRPLVGQVWFTDFDLMWVEGPDGFERLLGNAAAAEFAESWSRQWGYDREGGLAANAQVAVAEIVAAPF
jgi:hypothetical protein